MKIAISGIEVLSIRYRSFDELTDEYVDHETKRGRRVPDYDLGILLTAIGIYTLKKTADELIREVLEIRQRRKGEENARTQSELKKKRHSELLDKIDELIETVQSAAATRPSESGLSEDAASVSALLQWAKQNNLGIVITLETEAEGDLKEAFETLTINVPGSSVSDAERQLKDDDSA